MEVQNEISREINEKLLHETVEVMVEGPSKTDENVYTGHTRTNKIVLFKCAHAVFSAIQNVHNTAKHTAAILFNKLITFTSNFH